MGEGAQEERDRPGQHPHGGSAPLSLLDVTSIAAADDPRLSAYAAIRERDLVGRQRRFIVEGEVTLRAMLAPGARYRIESILLVPARLAALQAAIAALPAAPPVYVADKAVMAALAGFPIHRGVLAVGLRGDEPEPDRLIPPHPAPATVVALVGLTNHDNVGGVFRAGAAFGADAVLIDAQTCDPLYRKAIRVSAGAALTLPFARVPDAAALLALAQRHGLVPLAFSPGAVQDLADVEWPARALVILGTEGPGLPANVMAQARPIRIAMRPGFDSLNVATAGAIALHHAFGARGRGDALGTLA